MNDEEGKHARLMTNNVTDPETVVGILCAGYDWDDTRLCSIAELRRDLRRRDCSYTARQYCDFRYNTNLQRFIYDPFRGTRIDWKEVRRLLEE